MRCTNCGHDCSEGSTFCLNCGSRVAAPAGDASSSSGQTLQSAGGLPATVRCTSCGAESSGDMNFCQRCGTPLRAGMQPAPAPEPARARPPRPTPPGGMLASAAASSPTVRCPSCGGATPAGFAFCQMCGKPLAPAATPVPAGGVTIAPTARAGSNGAPAAGPAPAPVAPASAAQTAPVAPASAAQTAPVAPASAPPPAQTVVAPPPATASGVAIAAPVWGQLVAVNRDGSDGKSFPLSNDWVDIGTEAALAFDDRYLARQHARIERRGSAVRLVALDRLNGTFRRVRRDTPLRDGDVLLLGREVLRFELVGDDEREVEHLVQHGVALFGSPVRKAWGRLCQLLPNGSIRDVRHLVGPEVVLGREDGDVVFSDDEFLSRRHAALRWHAGRAVLADLESSNGTFLRVREPVELEPGDHLRLGDQMFRFESV